jgi:hypothetical protein
MAHRTDGPLLFYVDLPPLAPPKIRGEPIQAKNKKPSAIAKGFKCICTSPLLWRGLGEVVTQLPLRK